LQKAQIKTTMGKVYVLKTAFGKIAHHKCMIAEVGIFNGDTRGVQIL